jgi:hypothetical protein
MGNNNGIAIEHFVIIEIILRKRRNSVLFILIRNIFERWK